MIIDVDVFGKPITLKFNKKGESHKTLLGGILSFIAIVIILSFAAYRSYVMINKLENNLSSVT